MHEKPNFLGHCGGTVFVRVMIRNVVYSESESKDLCYIYRVREIYVTYCAIIL